VFLEQPPDTLADPPHDCLIRNHFLTAPCPDLTDLPIVNPDLVFYVDGSSSISLTGIPQSGYAIVTDTDIQEAAAFQTSVSAQKAKLFALTRACILATGKGANIYTNSRYAFGVTHDFARLWQQRDFLTSAGTPIQNAHCVKNLLDAIQLPRQLAVIKFTAYIKRDSPVQLGNACADSAAKAAAA